MAPGRIFNGALTALLSFTKVRIGRHTDRRLLRVYDSLLIMSHIMNCEGLCNALDLINQIQQFIMSPIDYTRSVLTLNKS